MVRHLEEQQARRHEDYQKAEIAALRQQLTEAESKIQYILRRLGRMEDVMGIPGE